MLKVSKLDAAKRQLETAITLYFHNGDPVSTHTLTAAAYNIIRDINNDQNGQPMIVKDKFLEYAKQGKEKQVRRILNDAENFFKHANNDPDETLDFNPEKSEMFILDACVTYFALTKEFTPLFKLYQIWFIAHSPEIFDFPESMAHEIKTNASGIKSIGKEAFFSRFLPRLYNKFT